MEMTQHGKLSMYLLLKEKSLGKYEALIAVGCDGSLGMRGESVMAGFPHSLSGVSLVQESWPK